MHLQLKQTLFYSRQVYTSLTKSISNYVFKEEKKIDLDSNKTEAITEMCSTKQFFSWCLKLWKILAKKFMFLVKLRLEACNFTKSELFLLFTLRIPRSHVMDLRPWHLLRHVHLSGCFWARAQIEHIFILTLSWRWPLSYRNQSIDLLHKSMDWFLYDNGWSGLYIITATVMKELILRYDFLLCGTKNTC